MIDAKYLRELTDRAIEIDAQRQERKIALEAVEAIRKQKQAELLAERIIGQILLQCENEAAKGRSHAIVMGLKAHRDYPHYSNVTPKPDELSGAGLIVWQYCSEVGLKPTIESWHDGVGIEGGNNIVAHW